MGTVNIFNVEPVLFLSPPDTCLGLPWVDPTSKPSVQERAKEILAYVVIGLRIGLGSRPKHTLN